MEDASAPTSKKGAKKAEAKAKKEALKAQRAAELAAAAAANLNLEDDPAKDNYGNSQTTTPPFSKDAEEVEIRSLDESYNGKTVIVRAWLQNSRVQSAKMGFVELRKGGNWNIQGVVLASEEEPIVSRRMVKWITSINPESFVAVEAKVKQPLEPVKSCRVSGLELHITKCFVLAPAPTMLGMTLGAASQPIVNFSDEKAQAGDVDAEKAAKPAAETTTPAASMLTHLDNIAMHKRAPVQQAIADIRIQVKRIFRSYLEDRGFKEFEPPCLIGAASEGGGNVFRLAYFGEEAFLAQSPQFYKQFEIAGGRERVFSIGPVFRAENSNTPRHMTEFTGLDVEMEIKHSYTEVLTTLEGVLLSIFRGIQERCADEIETVRSVYHSEPLLLPEPGKEVRLTFAEAQKLLREEGPAEFANVRDDEDMSTPQEKALGEVVRLKYKTDFYVIDKFPETARPFYAKVDDAGTTVGDGVRVTNAFDFFIRGQEVLSGGQRIHDPAELEDRIRAKGVDPESGGIKEYLTTFRQVGVPPHGGGGIGLDRVVAWFLALPSVHLAAYYPRTPKRLLP
ncbi:aspartyl-tRNA synthetase [Colletotrichum higginsianum]|uniref:Probable aspartate--tRNA ligase, cytoplasmic n=4 Tax=Colletotrichum destructivum species complex TaxID=2707350 RepID=H1V1W1_COLHI|nr:Aspartyl-tRNA synthetase [Colletotrichum higginsianum IMI 349063]OBR10536.1 Aspartyl-tRNA synthetase [Colletotrichum higginsianum IMI 349063]TID06444.1 Aspartate--tRNA ligase, cytoplasmic [Colletotrichum higginsianum]WQF87712.1 Class II Aminoacyl-tRNA synthetase/Biotinyl protein ligase (BPL) and lipoyl protein ligase (LPL) [Colletotrichum destructivum]CCF34213.1 aspartyl-tRNA synthetase [Colletotrichum higginsianum]